MKRKFALLLCGCLMLLLFSKVYPQNLKFGGRAGANLGFFSGKTDPFDKKMRMGIGFGGVIELWIDEMFGIQANALYNMKGAKIEGSIEDNLFGSTVTYTTKETYKFSYLSLPIFAKLAFGAEGSPKIFLIGGGSYHD